MAVAPYRRAGIPTVRSGTTENNKPEFAGEWVKLGDVCEIVNGATPRTEVPEYWGGDIKWVTPAELRNEINTVFDTAKHLTKAGFESASLRMMPAGTILLTTRAPIGKLALAGDEMCCNQGFKCLICPETVNNEWLCRLLKHRVPELQAMGTGATFKELSKRAISDYKICVPSMEAQIDIVKKLTKLDEVLANCRALLSALDDLVKSQFVEMFGGNRTVVPMGRLVSSIISGTNVGGQQRPLGDGEYGVLKISSVTKGVFLPNEFKVVDDVTGVKMIHPRKGDLLFSRANTSEMVGATAIVDRDYDRLFLPDKLWRLEPAEGVEAVFLKALLSSPSVRSEMSRISTGSNGSMQNISMAKFKKLSAFLPPVELQRQFADFVARVDKLGFGIWLACKSLHEPITHFYHQI